MTSPVVNLTRYTNRSATVTVTVQAGDVSAETPDRLREIVAGVEGIAREPAPTVRLRSVSGGRASYEVVAWGADHDRVAGTLAAAILASGAGWDVQGA